MAADTPDDRGRKNDAVGRAVNGQISPADRDAMKRHASELGSKLETAKGRHSAPSAAGRGAAMGRGMRAAADLIGGVVVGGALGWFLDSWLNTKPWLFIVFFLLGSGAGMLNVIRQAQRETTPPAPSVKGDAEDA